MQKKHFVDIEKSYRREEKSLFDLKCEINDLEEEIAIYELSSSIPNHAHSELCQKRDELGSDYIDLTSTLEFKKRELKLIHLQILKGYLSSRTVQNAEHFAKEILSFVWK